MKNHLLISFLTALVLVVCSCASAAALSASTLSIGSRGDSVKKLQQALIDLGYLKGKADGIFGQLTYKAVCSFQTAKKLTVDGLAGKKTQSLLFAASEAAPAASSYNLGRTRTGRLCPNRRRRPNRIPATAPLPIAPDPASTAPGTQ